MKLLNKHNIYRQSAKTKNHVSFAIKKRGEQQKYRFSNTKMFARSADG